MQNEAAPSYGILILAGGTLIMALAVLVIRYASFHYPTQSAGEAFEDE